jgi:integrase
MSSSTPATRTTPQQKKANGQCSVYKQKNRAGFTAAAYDINGKRHTKQFKYKKDGDAWCAEQERARKSGQSTYSPYPKMLLKDFLHQWLEVQPINNENTYRSYLASIDNLVVPYIGNLKAATISPHAINKWLGDLVAEQYSKGSLDLAFHVMRASFKYAHLMGDFPQNPMLRVKKPKLQSKPTKQIPHEDFQKIYLESAKDPFMHARIEVGMMMGLRPGEVHGLQWSDLDQNSKTLTIERQVQRSKGKGLVYMPVKTKHARMIPITDEQIRILVTHRRYQDLQKASWKHQEDLIFPNSVGGKLDAKKDRRMFDDVLKRAEVKHYQCYQMRKTAYSNLAHVTDSATMLQYTGHSSISTVMKHYAFASTESMNKAMDGMDKLRPVITPIPYQSSDSAAS